MTEQLRPETDSTKEPVEDPQETAELEEAAKEEEALSMHEKGQASS